MNRAGLGPALHIALTFSQGTGETSESPRGCIPARTSRMKPGLAEAATVFVTDSLP